MPSIRIIIFPSGGADGFAPFLPHFRRGVSGSPVARTIGRARKIERPPKNSKLGPFFPILARQDRDSHHTCRQELPRMARLLYIFIHQSSCGMVTEKRELPPPPQRVSILSTRTRWQTAVTLDTRHGDTRYPHQRVHGPLSRIKSRA